MPLRSFLLVVRRLLLLTPLTFAFVGLLFLQPSSQRTVVDSRETNSVLRDIIASARLADLRWPDFSDYKSHLTNFYEPSEYTPVWIQGIQPSAQALSMIEVFKKAWKKGHPAGTL